MYHKIIELPDGRLEVRLASQDGEQLMTTCADKTIAESMGKALCLPHLTPSAVAEGLGEHLDDGLVPHEAACPVCVSRLHAVHDDRRMRTESWHHGYSAGAMLDLVALALRECDGGDREWYRATANCVRRRAESIDEVAHNFVQKQCGALLTMMRTIGGASNQADYLVWGLAHRQPDWIQAVKRRKDWLVAAVQNRHLWPTYSFLYTHAPVPNSGAWVKLEEPALP